jgi:drug/metabolite transporter (DMT)-like permease
VALAGVGLIVYQAGAAGTPSGIALTVAGVAACAGYTIACRKLMINDAVLTVVLAQQACAFAFAVALLASVNVLGLTDTIGGTTDLNTVSPTAWAAAGLSGVTYYGLAFWLYLTGLRHVPASVAGIFITLIPAFGITGGYLLLDERLNPRQWAGAVIVVLAVATVAAQQRPEPATAT